MTSGKKDAARTSCRKTAHIRICLEQDVECGTTLLDDVTLIHQSLPEIDFHQIDTATDFFGKRLTFPLVIAGMTGGCPEAVHINRTLARVAQKKGVAFGVGSQRAMIEDQDMIETYAVRDSAPDILLLGNIGITALKEHSHCKIISAAEVIGADALCVHINPAQELFQNEGDLDFTACVAALSELCRNAPMPIVGKEVGNGISRETALQLKSAGVHAIDVGGYGGTSWVRIDSIRSGMDAGQFANWGIPTAAAIMESTVGLPLIATGGIRSGLDMAKAIALGADICGIALPFLRAVMIGGQKALETYFDSLIRDFRRAMYLTGSSDVQALKKNRYIISGDLQKYVSQSGRDMLGR